MKYKRTLICMGISLLLTGCKAGIIIRQPRPVQHKVVPVYVHSTESHTVAQAKKGKRGHSMSRNVITSST